MALKLESSAFGEAESIPTKHTCDGANISPSLMWTDTPDETASFAIIFDDPDAPAKTWVHWVLYNIPADRSGLEEHVTNDKELNDGALHGTNDFGNYGYGGPCPPSGTHRYVMKLFALDTMLDLDAGATKKQLLEVMEAHIIEQAELTGKYSRG